MDSVHLFRLFDTIRTCCDISRNSMEEISAHCSILELNKNDTFIKKGLANEREYFLLQGIVRSYVIASDGNDVTVSFYHEKSILPPNSTRTAASISTLYFESLTKVALATVNAGLFSDLMCKNAEINRFAHRVLELEVQAKTQKEIGLAVLPAKERLLELRAAFPMLENLVPHAHIAGYLGITQVSLSRLRKEIAGGK